MKSVSAADLSIFLAIARHLSFRRASLELGVSPSALSHALRNIEERLDLRLFNRTTRSVALTEAGERLHSRIKPAFLDIDDAIEDLNSFRGRPVGSLRINASRQAARLVLLPLVLEFQKSHPDVRVEVVIDNALVDVVSAGFDAGVRFGEIIAADMIATAIGPRHRFAVVGSPGYFRHHPVPSTPHDLGKQPCIRYRFLNGAFYRWEFEKGGVELDIEVDGPLTLSEQDLMVDAALAGAGLAYVFEGQVEQQIAKGSLVRVLSDWCPDYPGFFLYYPSRRQVPAALKAFTTFVRAAQTPTRAGVPRRKTSRR